MTAIGAVVSQVQVQVADKLLFARSSGRQAVLSLLPAHLVARTLRSWCTRTPNRDPHTYRELPGAARPSRRHGPHPRRPSCDLALYGATLVTPAGKRRAARD